MKETPIIMSGNHPKLILDGLKTMARRVIKPQPEIEVKGQLRTSQETIDNFTSHFTNLVLKCPYGQVGDRLWVRESWSVSDGTLTQYYIYKADGHPHPDIVDAAGHRSKGKWRLSIHMPRRASRIERIITLLRVERLRDISEADAKAEGGYSIEEFIKLFLKINHLPEDADPWNWVIGW